jgi:hypothetical protein
MLEGSVDTIFQHAGLDGATTLGSVNALLTLKGVFAAEEDIFAAFETCLGNIKTRTQFKSLLALAGVGLADARLGLGSPLIPAGQGQAPTQQQ